ncbi:hypothetical protein QR680_003151 [Steinernema hermaphroditum]|uniref:PDZ domain-containing protein n=1 Tax=Steinernema hermaphroditum TaxID=289476 RepID=A0AA39LJM7_9BILA|nr:hypothetical protein QR680_003151 [Steinernema hermaphroditum]
MWDTVSVSGSDGCGCCYRASGAPRKQPKSQPYPGPSPASSRTTSRYYDPRSPFFLMPYTLDNGFNGIEKLPSTKRKSKNSKSLYPQDRHAPSQDIKSKQSNGYHFDNTSKLENAGRNVKQCPSLLDATTLQRQKRGVADNYPKGLVTVVLNRPPGTQLGLGVAGGADRPYSPTITYLRPGFFAHRCDQLQVGERIRSVNGIAVGELNHDQVLTVLRSAGDRVQLEIEYDLNDGCFSRPQNTMNKCTDITLEKEGGSFGLTLRGGAFGPDHTKSRPITVTNIRVGGPAHREGRLRIGDRIISINGIDVYSATLAVAQKLLQECRDRVTLTVEYDVSVLETVKKAKGPLLVEIDKNPGVDLGAVLAIRTNESNLPAMQSIIVEDVIPATVADRCGAVHIGDEILAIDGIGLEYTTLAEAKMLLKGHANTVRLELIPYSQMKNLSERETRKWKQRKAETVKETSIPASRMMNGRKQRGPSSTTAAVHQQQLRAKSHDRAVLADQKGGGRFSAPRELRSDFSSPIRRPQTGSLSGSVPNINEACAGNAMVHSMATSLYQPQISACMTGSISGSLSGVPCGQVCHSETMEVVLHSYAKGSFGFVLHRQAVHGSSADSSQQPPLFISYIEKGSPADKCGVLQVGDRVLTVNDWCTANGSVEEANLVLRHATSPLTLTVEFDVIESVLPSSGLFTVKLAKRGNNLGITARSETDGQKGEPVVINDIRTGSVAHRCGSIRPGDRILAIDNIPLDTCTVEEAMRLLQRSSDIVKLRVKKGNSGEKDDVTAQQTIAYSIELNRKGQPLGLTIASTGEPDDPVIISQLAPGGLAERTGALHAGDRILAINGESIKGKKVADAMRILQQSTEVVTIKVSRLLDSFVSGYGKSVPYYSQYNQLSIKPYPGVGTSGAPSDSVSEHSDKMGTPIQSIDSAVDSLDDSPDAAKNASRSSAINPTSIKYVEELSAHVNNSLQDWTISGDALNNNPCAVPRMPKSALKKTPTRGVAVNRPLTTNTNVGNMPQGAVSAASSGGGGDQTGWDSGLSSTTDTNGGANECCSCACQKAGGDDDNWIKILEALETVGEAEMLKKLEESIMCGNVPVCKHQSSSPGANATNNSTCTPQGSHFQNNNALVGRAHHPTHPSGLLLNNSTTTNTILKHPILPAASSFGLPSYQHHRSQRSLSSDRADSLSLNSSSDGGGTHFDLPPAMPHPKSAGGSQRLNNLFKQLSTNDPSIPYMTSPVNSGDKPSTSSDFEPASLFSGLDHFGSKTKARGTTYRVILTKDPNCGGFGFSVSDGAGENQGVYISAVLPGSPAARCGLVKPMDRILQVNDTSLQYLDCDLAVPLLSTDTVNLLLYRDPTMKMIAEEEELSSCVSSVNLNIKDTAF